MADEIYVLRFEDREIGRVESTAAFRGLPSIDQITEASVNCEGSTVFTEGQYHDLIKEGLAAIGHFHVVYLKKIELLEGEGSTAERLAKIHKLSSTNQEAIAVSKRCGCFHCLLIYKALEVKEFVDSNDTAVCPYCSVDAVLPDSKVKLNTQLLWDMHQAYFRTNEKNDVK